jgi:hypothetical protein
VPCVNISVLAVLVFLLPSDSRRKITLSISILVALLVFYLLLIELIPPTSLVIPLLGKYLLFTLVLVNLSIAITIVTLNVHFRRHSTVHMASWMKKILLVYLPTILWMKRPIPPASDNYYHRRFPSIESHIDIEHRPGTAHRWRDEQRRNLLRATASHVAYIAQQIQNTKNEKEVRNVFVRESCVLLIYLHNRCSSFSFDFYTYEKQNTDEYDEDILIVSLTSGEKHENMHDISNRIVHLLHIRPCRHYL